MDTDSDRDERYLIDESDELVLIAPVQTVGEDVYLTTDDDLDDDSRLTTGDDLTGTRSMGGAVGTEHRHDA
jgi:hypothetical protein